MTIYILLRLECTAATAATIHILLHPVANNNALALPLGALVEPATISILLHLECTAFSKASTWHVLHVFNSNSLAEHLASAVGCKSPLLLLGPVWGASASTAGCKTRLQCVEVWCNIIRCDPVSIVDVIHCDPVSIVDVNAWNVCDLLQWV